MEPGRELDCEIAKYIRGTDIAHYSTDTSAAFEVLNVLHELYDDVVLRHNKNSRWSVSVNGRCLCSFIDSVPYALCLAVLRAREQIK